MNPSRRTSLPFMPFAAALFVAAVLLGGFLFMRAPRNGPPVDAPGADITGSTIGGAFALVNPDGRTVRDTDFAGRYRLVYFGYSFCPDICPVDLQKLMRGLSQFEKADAARGAGHIP